MHPGAAETADGVDQDCDGKVDDGTTAADDDHDGYTEGQGDTDDDNPYVYPGATELPDGLDNDGDCNEANAAIYPTAGEKLDGVDNDCDGTVDEGTTAYDDDGDGYTEQKGTATTRTRRSGPA